MQVGIENDGAVARRKVEARQHGVLLSEVARQVYVAHPPVLGAQLLDDVQGMVAAAVVHEQQLIVVVGMLVGDGLDAAI